MRAAARLGWRIAAVVAFGATAALAVTLTRGAPMHAALISQRNHDTAPGCVVSGLRISLGPDTTAATGLGLEVTRYALDFTNVSGTACALGGYPEVAAYRGSGVQVGNAAAADTTAIAHRVVLAPGGTARTTVIASVASSGSASAGGCRPVVAAGLRIAPPGQHAARYIRHSLLACSAAGPRAPVFLSVRALQPVSAGKLDSLTQPAAAAPAVAAGQAGRPRIRSRAARTELRRKLRAAAAPAPSPPALADGPAW